MQDAFQSTTAKILSGTYANAAADLTGRTLVQAVDTGWTAAGSKGADKTLASDILTLWGMAPLGAPQNGLGDGQTAPYTLSLTYRQGDTKQIGTGAFGIGTRDAAGNWVNAVDENISGHAQFVMGPWNASYGLGTYGVDASTKTAWAVLDYNGDFAAANNIVLGRTN